MAEKSVVEKVRLAAETKTTGINNLKLSKWISRIMLKECILYVIWISDGLVFSNWRGLRVKSISIEKPLAKCTLKPLLHYRGAL